MGFWVLFKKIGCHTNVNVGGQGMGRKQAKIIPAPADCAGYGRKQAKIIPAPADCAGYGRKQAKIIPALADCAGYGRKQDKIIPRPRGLCRVWEKARQDNTPPKRSAPGIGEEKRK